MITRVRLSGYYHHIIPRLEKMGEAMTQEAVRRGYRVSDTLIRSVIDEITASPSGTPEEDMTRWCDNVLAGLG